MNENRKNPNGLLVVNLPEGPTAHFKLPSIKLSKKIKGHGKPTRHMPELASFEQLHNPTWTSSWEIAGFDIISSGSSI